MTVPSTQRRAGPFTGTGAIVAYPFTFKVFQASDLKVTVADTSGVETVLVNGSSMVVSLNADQDATPGGDVQYAVAGVITGLPTGYTLVITGEGLEYAQTADLPQGGNYSAVVVENALDRMMMLLQIQAEILNRALVFSPTDSEGSTLPPAADRANLLLGFNALGQLLLTAPVSGSAADLALNLANTANAALGAALAGFNGELNYAAGTLGGHFSGVSVNAKDHPWLAKFDNATDDRAALVAAITWVSGQGGGVVELPRGTALIGSSFTVPENVILRGQGKGATTLKRNFSGVLITQMGRRSGLEHLQLNGNAGSSVIVTFTGGIDYDYQRIYSCRIWNTSAQCVTFAHETGAECRVTESDFYTSGTPGATACIATLSAGESIAVPRHFISNAGGGATLYDFSGANDTFAFGGYTNGFITSATTTKLLLSNMRVANTYGMTIAGINLCIRDCVFALAPTLTCEDSIFECITPGWVVTDNGDSNAVFQRLVQYTPVWTASTANPNIGNGSITGYYSRQGAQITVQLDIRFGTTTTFGTGFWRFSVPRVDLSPYPIVQVVGSGFTQGSGANDFIVIPRINAGNSYIELFTINTAGVSTQIGSATQAWSTSGVLRLSFTYLTN